MVARTRRNAGIGLAGALMLAALWTAVGREALADRPDDTLDVSSSQRSAVIARAQATNPDLVAAIGIDGLSNADLDYVREAYAACFGRHRDAFGPLPGGVEVEAGVDLGKDGFTVSSGVEVRISDPAAVPPDVLERGRQAFDAAGRDCEDRVASVASDISLLPHVKPSGNGASLPHRKSPVRDGR